MRDSDDILRLGLSDPDDVPWPKNPADPTKPSSSTAPQEPRLVPIEPQTPVPPQKSKESAKRSPGRLDDSRGLSAPELKLREGSTAHRDANKEERRRGAQPGNMNALRHGFYARNLGQVSPRRYPEEEMRNLYGEAAMLKDYMYFLYNKNLDSTDGAVLAETLRALALAGMALARVIQVHLQVRVFSGKSNPIDDILSAFKDQ